MFCGGVCRACVEVVVLFGWIVSELISFLVLRLYNMGVSAVVFVFVLFLWCFCILLNVLLILLLFLSRFNWMSLGVSAIGDFLPIILFPFP